MKKVFLPLVFMFASSVVFAQSAQDIYVKMSKTDLTNSISTIGSYEAVYEYEAQNSPNTKMYYTETVNGSKRRMDIKSVTPRKTTYCSIILGDEADYVSVRAVVNGDKTEFSGYQEIKNASSVRTLSGETKSVPALEIMNVSFDNDAAKKDGESVIKLTTKNKKEAIEKYQQAQQGNNENYTAADAVSLWFAMFDIRYWVDKKTFLASKFNAVADEDALYEMMKDSDEWKDKSEQEKREAAKEAAKSISSLTFEGTMSDYRKIEGSSGFYPFEVSLKSFDKEKGETIVMAMKTVSFKILDGKKVDNSMFTPSSIKKGSGIVPREFTFYGNFMSSIMGDLKKEIRDSAKEAIKEQAKEDIKSGIKGGLKGGLKGLGRF
jgi:hypothetical protein